MSVTQQRISGRFFLDYVIALMVAWLAFIVRQAIVRYVGHEVPTYIVFYPAIMVAALPGGLGPGLLSTAAAASLTIYYILPPHGQFAIQHSYDAIAVGLFCAMGVFISVVAELYRRKRIRSAAVERELALQSAKDALREVSEQRRVALEAAELGSWDYRIVSGEVFWDERCRSLFGISEGDRIDYQEAIARIHHEDRAATDQAVKRAIASVDNGVYSQEFRVVWPDGSIHWVSSHGRVHFEGEGEHRQATRFIGINIDITAAKRTEQELQQRREWLRVTLRSIGDAVLTCDDERRITFLNPVAEALTGWSSAEALGEPIEQVFRIVDERTGEPAADVVDRVLREQCTLDLANHTSLLTKDGRRVPVEDSAAPITDSSGEVTGAVLVFHDVTERRHKQEQLSRLHRTLQALNNSNHAMLHATTEEELLKQVCSIVTQDCGHAMVWVGYAENDEAKSVRPVAHAGFEEGYLETLQVSWADTERGRGPTGTAIRIGRPCACRNMLQDPTFAPWRDEALRRGYAASVALPLLAEGKAFGTLTIYSRTPDAFSQEEVGLLSDLAADLAFGITTLRLRAAHEFEVNRRHAVLRGINTIFEEALRCCTEEELGQKCLQVAEQITGSKFGFLGELGAEGFLYDTAVTDPGWQLCSMFDQTVRRRPPESCNVYTMFVRVVTEGRSLFANNLAALCAGLGTAAGHPPLTCFLGVPLVHGGRTIGMLAVGNREGGYRREEQESLEALAPVIVEALQRIRAEQALRAQEARLRLALDAANSGTLELDLATMECIWSDEIWSLHGLKRDAKASYENWLAPVHPQDREVVRLQVAEVARNGGELNLEYRVGADFEARWLMVRGRTSRNEAGRVLRLFGVVMDITERKRAETALIRSEKLASVGRMAAAIAHEINNPLAAVMNILYLARAGASSPHAVRQYLDVADEELRRVSHITRQTLGFYRESSGVSLVSVGDVLDSAVDVLQGKIRARDARLQKRYASDLEIAAVSGELRQVFSNLLANSLDAIEEHGEIALRASSSFGIAGRRCVRVTIADNGRGIDPALGRRIFEPLFTTKGSTGTGLGLWVSRQIVEKHGGTIRFRSRTQGDKRGTVFSVLIPVSGEAVKDHAAKAGS